MLRPKIAHFFMEPQKDCMKTVKTLIKSVYISKSSVKEFFRNAELTKIVTKVGDK